MAYGSLSYNGFSFEYYERIYVIKVVDIRNLQANLRPYILGHLTMPDHHETFNNVQCDAADLGAYWWQYEVLLNVH